MMRNILKALGKDITPPYVGHGFVNDLLKKKIEYVYFSTIKTLLMSPEGDFPYRLYFQKTVHYSKEFFPSVGLHRSSGLRFIPTQAMRVYNISDLFVLRVVLVV